MAMSADEIIKLIQDALPDAVVEMTDLAGDNDLYAALKGSMDGANGQLHALALETKAPAP